MQNKANFKKEDRKQKTAGSRIRAKSTPKLLFSVPTNFFYNCRESSTNRPFYAKQSQFSGKSNGCKLNYIKGL